MAVKDKDLNRQILCVAVEVKGQHHIQWTTDEYKFMVNGHDCEY